MTNTTSTSSPTRRLRQTYPVAKSTGERNGFWVMYNGQEVEAYQIGFRDHPEDSEPSMNKPEKLWLVQLHMAIDKGTWKQPTKEGVQYATYLDPVTAFDTQGYELHVGDTICVAIKNSVHRAKLVKISPTPYHLGYGVMVRKLTVRLEDGSTKTINNPADTLLLDV